MLSLFPRKNRKRGEDGQKEEGGAAVKDVDVPENRRAASTEITIPVLP
jgi:hypothetical protein